MKICIVGGGSAGWMSATTFSELLDYEKITLIESPNIPISGVGESTLRQIRIWLDLIGIDDEDFLEKTDGTFKHSIKFTNFLKKDSGSFHYPFGIPEFDPKTWWSYGLTDSESSPNDYSQNINATALVSERGKFDENCEYAFHFDAVKFGQYLKDTYCKDVEHIKSDIVGCEISENGIKHLLLDNGLTIEADLFIDCTGFKSLLLGEYLQEPFIPYNHLLPNDSAWATQVQYNNKEKEMVAYTECTAIDNGWVWNIPLWSRIGTGYVYSSKHVSDEDAKQEFIEHLHSKGFNTSDCKFKKIPMRIGRHEKTFVKNVIAIGLSAGFIEPLESNGLLTIHKNLIDLYKTLRRGKPSQLMKDMYNKVTSIHFDEFADFVAAHYAFTQREDTQYWKDNFNRQYSLENSEKYGFSSFLNEMYRTSKYEYPEAGFHYIASGMNICPYTENLTLSFFPEDIKTMKEANAKWEDIVKKLPSLYDYLRRNVHCNN